MRSAYQCVTKKMRLNILTKNHIIPSPYTYFFWGGLVFFIVSAWFSTGYLHPDEHFQILEFCSYKMHRSVAAELPWEFFYKVRFTLLPSVAYIVGNIMNWLGRYNPFTHVFLLRLVTGIATWFVVRQFCLLLMPQFKTNKGKIVFVFLSMFLWYVPLLSVRFTPEQISGITFLLGFCLILPLESIQKRESHYFMAGLLFGMTFCLRIQMCPAIAGLIAYLFCVKKVQWKYFLILFLGILTFTCIGVMIDRWFYGEWVLTPVNYYYVNIILHRANDYGTSPWWDYVYNFLAVMPGSPLEWFFFPLNCILLIVFIIGFLTHLRDPCTWIIIPFLLTHSLIAHKELRFLYPMLFIFIYILSKGFDYFFTKFTKHRMINAILAFLFLFNILLLIRAILPANPVANFYQKINELNQNYNDKFIYLSNEHTLWGSKNIINFFKTKKIKVIAVGSIIKLESYLNKRNIKSAYVISNQEINFHNLDYQVTTIYSVSKFEKILHPHSNNRIIQYVKRLESISSV